MLFYGIIDYFKINYGRWIVILIFLSIFLIVFPSYYHVSEDCCECYNPFSYFKIYWNIGVPMVLAAHLMYIYLLNKKPKNT